MDEAIIKQLREAPFSIDISQPVYRFDPNEIAAIDRLYNSEGSHGELVQRLKDALLRDQLNCEQVIERLSAEITRLRHVAYGLRDRAEIAEGEVKEKMNEIRLADCATAADGGNQEAEHGWISIKDRLPEPGEYVLTVRHFGSGEPGIEIERLHQMVGGWVFVGKVTHWRPLPEPPALLPAPKEG